MATESDIQLVKKMGTPTRLAHNFSNDLFAQGYDIYPWILLLEREILEARRAGGKKGFVINAPPQSGKSSTVMWIVAWLLMMYPSTRGAYITYSQPFSQRWGRAIRKIAETLGPRYFGVTVDRDNRSVNDWGFDGTNGGLLSVGIDGGITGRSVDLGVLDDVIKNDEEASSEATLKHHWDEFNASVINRLQDDAIVLVIATRWTQGDISGRILEMIEAPEHEDAEEIQRVEWKALNFQAICEPPDDYEGDKDKYRDLLGRKPGDELVCWRRPGHWRGMRAHLIEAGDPYKWGAQFQGDPVVTEGSSFPPDHWGSIPIGELDNVHSRIRVWDLAATAGAGDWTVGELWGKYGESLVVIDVVRFRKSGEQVWDEILATARMDGTGTPIYMERERSGSGVALCDLYKKALPNHLVEGIRPDGTKFTRAKTYAQLQNRGKVLLPEGAPWVPSWVREHSGMMPDGRMPRYDDQIDAGSYAVTKLVEYDESILVIPQDIIRQQNGWSEELAGHFAAQTDRMLDGIR